jgi:hypothetical protein
MLSLCLQVSAAAAELASVEAAAAEARRRLQEAEWELQQGGAPCHTHNMKFVICYKLMCAGFTVVDLEHELMLTYLSRLLESRPVMDHPCLMCSAAI